MNGKMNAKVKVVGISSSPRRHGNSEILLDRALEGAMSEGADVEKIILNELCFKPCQECGGCDKSGVCVIRDDMDRIYNGLDRADVVIISSPIFFINLSAQAKMMIDRFHCRWMAKYMLKRPPPSKTRKGLFIASSGAYRKDHFENAKGIIRSFFATLDIEYTGDLFCGGLEKAALVSQDQKVLNEAYMLGKNINKR